LALSGFKVLVAESAPEILSTVTRLLEGAGATVVGVSDADAGRVAFESLSPDILLCDLSLTGRDGVTFLRELRLANAGGGPVPAIALTATGSSDEARRAILAGFQAHLPKAVEGAVLISRIAKLVAWSFRKAPPLS
jgi:CheY-like chemotaxis protein